MKEKLLQILTERKISVNQISKISGVPMRTIQSWLYGKVEPPIYKAEKVLNALGYEIIIKEVANEI